MPDYGKLYEGPDRIFDVPSQPQPTAALHVLDGIAKGISSFSNSVEDYRQKSRQDAALARQASKDAQDQGDREATNAAWLAAAEVNAGTYGNTNEVVGNTPPSQNTENPVFAGGGPVDKDIAEVASATNEWIKRLGSFEAARTQGRLPGVAKEALVDQAGLDLMKRFPGRESLVGKALQDAGFSNSLFNETVESGAVRKTEFEARNAARADAMKFAFARLGPAAEGMNDETLVAAGLDLQQKEDQFVKTKRQYELESSMRAEGRAVAGEGRTEQTFQKGLDADALRSSANQVYLAQMGPVISSYMKLMQEVDAGTDPGKEKTLADLKLKIQNLHATAANNIAAQVGAKSPDAAEAVRKSFDGQFKTLFTDILDSRNKNYADSLSILQNRLAINTAAALPMLSALKAAGIRPDALPVILEEAMNDPKLKESLSREIKGIGDINFNTDTGRVKLTQLVSILNKNTSLENYNPQQAASLVSKLSGIGTKIGREINLGKLENADYFVTSLGTVVTATNTLTPQSSRQANLAAALAITGNGQTRQALRKVIASGGPESEEAKVVLLGTRAGAAKTLSNLKRMGTKDGYYSIQYNNGRYDISFDQKAWAQNSSAVPSRSFAGGMEMSRGFESSRALPKPAMSSSIRATAATMNSLLDHLVETGDIDSNAPEGKTKEIRDYYAKGKPTTAMLRAQGKTPEQVRAASFETQANQLDTDLSNPRNFQIDAPAADLDYIQNGGGGSRGERNNNRGNIENGSFAKSQPGYAGTDGRFARFKTVEDGDNAQANLLENAYIKKGHNTVEKIIKRYGNDPGPEDDVNVANYIQYVAKKLGISPQDTITPAYTKRLAEAMREFETGKRNG